MFILSFATNVYFYIENQNLLHNLAYKELHEAVKVQECQKLLAMKSKKIQEQMLQVYAHQNNLNGFIPHLDDNDSFDDNVGKVDGIRGMPLPKHLNLPEPGINRAPSLVQNSDFGNEFDTHFDAESSKDPEPDFAFDDFAADQNPRIQAQAPAWGAPAAPAAPVQVIAAAPAAPVQSAQSPVIDLQEQEDRQKEREVIQKLNDFIENINKNGGAEAFANQLKDEPVLEAEIEHVQEAEQLIELAEENGNDEKADEIVDAIAEEVAEIVQDPAMEDIVAQEDEGVQETFEEIKEDAEEANDPWAEAAEEPAEPAFELPNDFGEPADEHESESDYQNENNEENNENEAFNEEEENEENEDALGFDEAPQEEGGEDDLSKNSERPIGIQESQSTRAENLQTSEENILNQETNQLTEFEPTMERQPLPQKPETNQEVSWLEPQPPMEQQQPVEQQLLSDQTQQPSLNNILDPLKPVVILNGGTSQAALGQRWDNEEDELMPNQGFNQMNPYNQFGQFNQFGQPQFAANQFGGMNQFGQNVPVLQKQKEEDPDEMSPVQIKNVQSLAESGGNARDCNHLYNLGVTQNGVYMIRPSPTDTPVQAKCDFRYSGGWTVIQHRFDGSVDFNKDWAAYETGFGQAQSEYWLGLEHITKLSKSADTRIRIDLTDFQGHKAYVEHENFFVEGPEDNYRLHVGIKRHGDLGDSFQVTSGEKFTTYDRDNDGWSGNCAQDLQGGGWYSKCSYANINGKYYPTGISSKRDGIYWAKFPADYRPPDPEKPGYRLNSFFYSMKEIKISILVDPNK